MRRISLILHISLYSRQDPLSGAQKAIQAARSFAHRRRRCRSGASRRRCTPEQRITRAYKSGDAGTSGHWARRHKSWRLVWRLGVRAARAARERCVEGKDRQRLTDAAEASVYDLS